MSTVNIETQPNVSSSPSSNEEDIIKQIRRSMVIGCLNECFIAREVAVIPPRTLCFPNTNNTSSADEEETIVSVVLIEYYKNSTCDLESNNFFLIRWSLTVGLKTLAMWLWVTRKQKDHYDEIMTASLHAEQHQVTVWLCLMNEEKAHNNIQTMMEANSKRNNNIICQDMRCVSGFEPSRRRKFKHKFRSTKKCANESNDCS